MKNARRDGAKEWKYTFICPFWFAIFADKAKEKKKNQKNEQMLIAHCLLLIHISKRKGHVSGSKWKLPHSRFSFLASYFVNVMRFEIKMSVKQTFVGWVTSLHWTLNIKE